MGRTAGLGYRVVLRLALLGGLPDAGWYMVTTKYCPRCKSPDLARFSTMNLKHCPDCRIDISWHLDEGQMPLLGGPIKKEKE